MIAQSTFLALPLLSALILGGPLLRAQNGDRPGEIQGDRIPADRIPPAPILSPGEALKSFKLPEGFRLELVASEPLIEAPVLMQFDPDGRLWVVEMRGFMRNPEGKGEEIPNGRISILEDTDQDGRMDKRTTFQDNLVLPRALALVRGGALVGEPPKLWFLRDSDGDLKADDSMEVAVDYGSRENPEHTSNGLLVALDNWIYSANHTTRFRYQDAEWKREPTVFRGQWGITQDDFGRPFFNSNSDYLRGDLTPSHYYRRNSRLQGVTGLNYAVAKDQTVWPRRMNPGVNRGYQPQQLRSDGTLATFTGACGPVIYRGDQFPREFHGNAFVCEPTGNLVRRSLLTETNGVISADNAYERGEFLTSTDERFRPVNLFNGPDGALYVVDMYRGIIQHRIYLTSYLRKQALSRRLENGLDLGRIYRIVHDKGARARAVSLSNAESSQLATNLAHPNGWHRDTAQRLLVERQDSAVAGLIRNMAAKHESPLARLHALWTLEGMGLLDRATIRAALEDSHERVAAAAVRLSEPLLAGGAEGELLPRLIALASDARHAVRLQVAFTLSALPRKETDSCLIQMLVRHAGDPLLREAAVSGWSGREVEMIESFTALPSSQAEKALPVIGMLARCTWAEGSGKKVERAIEIAAGLPTGGVGALAILEGLGGASPKPGAKSTVNPRVVKIPVEPSRLLALAQVDHSATAEAARRLASVLVWPGKPGYVEPKIVPLTAEEQARFEEGKTLYQTICGACHQPTGLGQEGLAPPLLDSEWTVGSQERLIRIVLHGVRGKISVKGVNYSLEMPPLGVLDDDQVANVLTYARREWGHTASPVDKSLVAKIRKETESRSEAWTEPELLKLP